MRLLHTSDWHLGQTLRDFDRSYEHQCFLDWLLATLDAEQADVLLIAGDVFDNPNPSAASQKQFYRFLQQARQRRPQLDIVVIAGNHDSPGRMEAPVPLLQALGIVLVGQVARNAAGAIDLERLVLPLHDRHGAIAAWCLAVPFLRSGDVPRLETADPYQDGVALLYRQVLALALCKRQPGQAIVAMGHCHMHGGEVSAESERPIVIGGSEALSASVFGAEVAYAALGHLHLAQVVGGHPHLRYCGSPLPMSFAEIGYPHQVLRVDLAGEAVTGIVAIPVPRAVDLLRVPGRHGTVDAVLASLRALDLPALPEPARPYLEVRVLQERPEPGLRARVEAALEGKPVRLARIDLQQVSDGSARSMPLSLDELERLQPADIFARLYQKKFASAASPELLSAFAELAVAAADGGGA